MTFWDFFHLHPWLGTVSLVMGLLVVDSVGVDLVRAVVALRGKL